MYMGIVKANRIGRCEDALKAVRKAPGDITEADLGVVSSFITDGKVIEDDYVVGHSSRFAAWLDEQAKEHARARDISEHLDATLSALSNFHRWREGVDEEDRSRAIAYIDAWLRFSENEPEPMVMPPSS